MVVFRVIQIVVFMYLYFHSEKNYSYNYCDRKEQKIILYLK